MIVEEDPAEPIGGGSARAKRTANSSGEGALVSRPIKVADRFRGALLGTQVGDALGMPVEGWPADRIREAFGEVRDMLPARLGRGTFTDDTQMTAALAEALVHIPSLQSPDPDPIARSFARRFDPKRGYGANTGRILSEIRGGRHWSDAVAAHSLPGGSFANGAAMRVAPAALAGYPSGRVAARLAVAQALPTGHSHPESLFGTAFQAVAVSEALRADPAAVERKRPEFVQRIVRTATEVVGPGAPPPAFRPALEFLYSPSLPSVETVRNRIGAGVRAAKSVPAALWAFLASPGSPEEVLVRAVGLGEDTDTVAAMAGALAGALNGAQALPARWVEVLEDGPCGRSHLVELADALLRRARNLGGSPEA